jgi:hypothetical protein
MLDISFEMESFVIFHSMNAVLRHTVNNTEHVFGTAAIFLKK